MNAEHGSVVAYRSGRCRCTVCVQANRDRQAAHRADRRARRVLRDGRWVAPLPQPFHGLYNTYSEWSCRCAPCVEANRVYSKAAYDRQRQRQRHAREGNP